MKVIFLDFDGVINNYESDDIVDKKNVEILKNIVKKSNAKIVVSSSVKYPCQLNEDSNITKSSFAKYIFLLKKLGVKIYDVTPLVECNRTLEIKKYLKMHKNITDYVILDDDIIGDELINHQVYLDLYKGLEPIHEKPALNILNGKLGFYPKDYDKTETFEKRMVRINNYYKKNI